MGFFKIDDIIAALLMSIAMYRRLETLSTRKEDNPHVPEAAFDRWRQMALRGYTQLAIVCVAKIALSVLWFVSFRDLQGWLQAGGLVIFVAWLASIVLIWRSLTEARAQRRDLSIGNPPR